jgi:hypothetical protein
MNHFDQIEKVAERTRQATIKQAESLLPAWADGLHRALVRALFDSIDWRQRQEQLDWLAKAVKP